MKFKFLFKPLIEGLEQIRKEKEPLVRFCFTGKRKKEDNEYESVTINTVKVTKINSFGFVHDLEYTKKGTPSHFNRWGYILLNSGAYYRVAIETIRELQDRLTTKRYVIDRKQDLTAIRNKKEIAAIDWHMSIKPNELIDAANNKEDTN